jgi:hypothetical protein
MRNESMTKEASAWARANRLAIKTIKAKLLALGGRLISPQSHVFVVAIARFGTPQEFPVTLREMESNRCHHNAKVLWDHEKAKEPLGRDRHRVRLKR